MKPRSLINLLNLSCNLAKEFLPPKSFQNWSLFKNLPFTFSYIIFPLLSLCKIGTSLILSLQISKEHVHLLVSCPPSLSVSKLVQQLKGKTSRVLLSEYKELKKRYWGQHLWSTGYFVRSVGTVTQSTIKEYIENQQDEYEENFKIMG